MAKSGFLLLWVVSDFTNAGFTCKKMQSTITDPFHLLRKTKSVLGAKNTKYRACGFFAFLSLFSVD